MRKSERSVAAIVVIATLSVSFLLCEVLAHIMGWGALNSPHLSHPVLHHVHPPGTRFVFYAPDREIGEHFVEYDELGRSVDPTKERPLDDRCGGRRVALIGDSFVEAKQLPFEQTMAGRLQDKFPSDCIWNFGDSSYSPLLSLLQWKERIRNLKPTHVFHLLYANDVSDDERYEQLAERDDQGGVIAVPGPRTTGIRTVLRQLRIARLIRRGWVDLRWRFSDPKTRTSTWGEGPEVREPTTQYVSALSDEAKNAGAQYVLSVVPSRPRLRGNPDAREFAEGWREWALAHGIRFIDLVPSFEQAVNEGRDPFFNVDIHFNAEGHRLVAERLEKWIVE